MEKKQKRGNTELTSLIPTIKNEEKVLRDLLEEEREKARETVRRAEAGAAEALRCAAEELPDVLASQRAARTVALREQAEHELAAARGQTRDLEREATARAAEAVALIVRKVWPEGKR
jgi:hypothetical protein